MAGDVDTGSLSPMGGSDDSSLELLLVSTVGFSSSVVCMESEVGSVPGGAGSLVPSKRDGGSPVEPINGGG